MNLRAAIDLVCTIKNMAMKNNLLMIVAVACIASLPAFGQESESVVAAKTDSLLSDAYAKGIFSGIVLIAHNGKEIYFNQLGFADWNTKRPLNRKTLFNIGSLNKQFTEEMIHQLVSEKKLAYDDLLSTYLDLYPGGPGTKITIQQLLDMKAGLGDYLNDQEFIKIRFDNFSLGKLLDIIRKEPLLFEPGTGQEYSNSGYVVLGAVIEKVTGKSYEENLFTRIMNPLGLQNMYYTKAQKAGQED